MSLARYCKREWRDVILAPHAQKSAQHAFMDLCRILHLMCLTPAAILHQKSFAWSGGDATSSVCTGMCYQPGCMPVTARATLLRTHMRKAPGPCKMTSTT